MNVLVTGCAGYMGSRLTPELLRRGYSVIGVDSLVFGDYGILPVLSHPNFKFLKQEIESLDRNILKSIDAIIHLAGISTEPSGQYNPRKTDLLNHIATVNLASDAKDNGVERFIFASSASVYYTFDSPNYPIPSKEWDKVNPISAYSLSKRAAEQGLLELKSEEFLPIILRKGTLYGVSRRMRYDLVWNSFVKNAVTKHEIVINSLRHIYRPMLDINEAIEAYITALELPTKKVDNTIYNVASGNYVIEDLATSVLELFKDNRSPEVEVKMLDSMITPRNYTLNLDRYRTTFCPNEYPVKDELSRIMIDALSCLDPEHAIYYNDKFLEGKL